VQERIRGAVHGPMVGGWEVRDDVQGGLQV
jgi:hypothetical protein